MDALLTSDQRKLHEQLAEAGMRILKELIFSRVKAYNLVRMFYFISETMGRYYQSNLLSVAHSRVDRYISLRC